MRAAYEHCEQVTKTQARNFSYGIMLLPGDKRRALSAVYAYARRIDDIGDGDLPPADKLTALAAAREEIGGLIAGAAPPADDLVLLALADAAGRMPIPLAAFGRADRGLRGRRAGHGLRDLRRPGALLPLRGRRHRPPVAGRVRLRRPGRRRRRWPTRWAWPCS